MMRADKREAEQIDAELDARDAARQPADAVTGTAAEPETAERPWWESDSRLTDRFKQR
jgi:hypothetical protein